MKAALVDEQRQVITSRRIPTGRADGPDAVAERIVTAVADQHAAATQLGRTVRGAGVVVPGIVDEVRGIAVFSANLGFRQVPLRDLIEKRVDVPVAFDHDVRAGGLAEGEHQVVVARLHGLRMDQQSSAADPVRHCRRACHHVLQHAVAQAASLVIEMDSQSGQEDYTLRVVARPL